MANNPRNEPPVTKIGAELVADDALVLVADAEEPVPVPVPVDLLLLVSVPEALAADPVAVDPEAAVVDSGVLACVLV